MNRKLKNIIKKGLRLGRAPFIVENYLRFKRAVGTSRRFDLRFANAHPCLLDKTVGTGFDRHYVYHTSWAARVLAASRPEKHVDISSSLYFVGILSAFIPVDFYDYRPADLKLSKLSSAHADLMCLPFQDCSVRSLSCMHVVEHVGLGRYGDPIDPDADIKAAKELSRVLAPGGELLFVVPVGAKALIEYNAHRIYSYDVVLSLFPDLILKEFSVIPEHEGGPISPASPQDLRNERYACGCFVFTK